MQLAGPISTAALGEYRITYRPRVSNKKKMTERYLRATAFHEAGHVVVAWSLGLPVGTVSVRNDDASGATEIGPADHLSLVEKVAVCSGGIAADAIFGYQINEHAAAYDRAKIMQLIKDNGISEKEQGPSLRAEGLNCARAHLERHRSKVILLAERLFEHGQIEGAEVLRLMQDR